MKVKIKSFNGELPCYLTEGKVYFVQGYWDNDNDMPIVSPDYGEHIVLSCSGIGCGHLNGGSWEIIEENTDTCTDIRNHISPNTKVIERWAKKESCLRGGINLHLAKHYTELVMNIPRYVLLICGQHGKPQHSERGLHWCLLSQVRL